MKALMGKYDNIKKILIQQMDGQVVVSLMDDSGAYRYNMRDFSMFDIVYGNFGMEVTTGDVREGLNKKECL